MTTAIAPTSPQFPAAARAAATAWLAVQRRDAAFNGRFVYAVCTTGVYCDPSCPSRRPRQENVRFFPTPAAAERGGYRPCRRCRPERASRLAPTVYHHAGKGMRVRYALVSSILGPLLVAATDRGVCAAMFGSGASSLQQALRQQYPHAASSRDDEALRPWTAAILAYLDGSTSELDLPVDLPATPFQWRVWRALQRIPYGSTRSYREVAEAIGAPSAARAVARACGSNRVALVIPCHRVVRQHGALGGYRWGIDRKERLLRLEHDRRKD